MVPSVSMHLGSDLSAESHCVDTIWPGSVSQHAVPTCTYSIVNDVQCTLTCFHVRPLMLLGFIKSSILCPNNTILDIRAKSESSKHSRDWCQKCLAKEEATKS